MVGSGYGSDLEKLTFIVMRNSKAYRMEFIDRSGRLIEGRTIVGRNLGDVRNWAQVQKKFNFPNARLKTVVKLLKD